MTAVIRSNDSSRNAIAYLLNLDDSVIGYIVCPHPWNLHPFDICIDPSCKYGCGRTRCSLQFAFSVLSQAPLRTVRMHLPFKYLDLLWTVLSTRQTVKILHLRFRGSSQTKFVRTGKSFLGGCSLPLESLTVFGWPPHVGNQLVLKKMLSAIGTSLKTLKMCESCPGQVFSALEEHCPNLEHLELEDASIAEDSLSVRIKSLRFLRLSNMGIALPNLIELKNLVGLQFVDVNYSCGRHVGEVADTIHKISDTIEELELRFLSVFANNAIVEIGASLHNLRELSLQFSDDGDREFPDDIKLDTIECMRRGCPLLESFEVTESLISINPLAFEALSEFKRLRKIKFLYNDLLVDLLPTMLRTSCSLEMIIFFENAGDLYLRDAVTPFSVQSQWEAMEERIQKLGMEFPGILIYLEDAAC